MVLAIRHIRFLEAVPSGRVAAEAERGRQRGRPGRPVRHGGRGSVRQRSPTEAIPASIAPGVVIRLASRAGLIPLGTQDEDMNDQEPFDVVTGAFGYSGWYIARRLLRMGRRVRTLTGHPERRDRFDENVEVAPFDFDRPASLAASLRGARTLYNTYWIRFPHRPATFDTAIENTKVMFRAAVEAGVRRIVHVSITNASEDSPLPYFRGKAVVERALAETGLSYAILRPTVLFGKEDILINNIAWFLRRFPFFVVPGSGDYRVQPVFVDDLAALAVAAGQESANDVLDAVGPEVFSFNELLELLAEAVGSRSRLVHLSPRVAVCLARCLGWFLSDVPLTMHEAAGLMANLLVSDQPPSGRTRFTEWLLANSEALGSSYSSELARHYR